MAIIGITKAEFDAFKPGRVAGIEALATEKSWFANSAKGPRQNK